MGSDLDTAYEAFLRADLDPARFLALDDADHLDEDDFAKAQKQSRKGSRDKRGAAAEQLAAMLADVGSGPALDQVVASAFDRAERWQDALEVRRKALELGGAWHPVHAGRLVGNVGYDLQKKGDAAAAVVWYERALAFDPCNPFVLVSLAELAVGRGDLAAAYGLRDYLESLELPASFFADLDALTKKAKRPADVTAYVPDLARLRPLSDEGFARFAAVSSFDRNGSAPVMLRGHAVACAMHGDLDAARLAAELAVDQETEDAGDTQIEHAWARGLVRALSARGKALDHDAEKRLAAAVDVATRRATLHDPHEKVRLNAAEQLGPDPFGDVLLREMAAMEDRRGIAYRHVAQTGLTATRVLRMRKIRAAGPRAPIVVPSEGADHPVFSQVAPGEALAVWMAWDEPITEELGTRFGVALQEAAKRAARTDPKAAIHQSVDPFAVGLFLVGVEHDPREAVRAVLEELAGVGAAPGESSLGPREVVAARIVLSERGGISHAVADPRMDVEDVDSDERWSASFDPTRKAPPSEPDGGLFISMPGPNGNVPELRLMPLYFPDVRVVYGLPEVTSRDRTPRADEVAHALTSALDARFRGVPPGFYAKGEVEGRVDTIVSSGRAGYAFALSGLTAEMVVHLPNTCRFREYELFSAIADAARALALAPVVHWYRGEGIWIVNLWEKG